MVASNTAFNNSSGVVSANPPRRALPIAVRSADTMTTSLSFSTPREPKGPDAVLLRSKNARDMLYYFC